MHLQITMNQQIHHIYDYIKSKINITPTIGIILGSGLGNVIEDVEEKITIPYKDIPYMQHSTAPGHHGNLIIGKFYNKNIIVMQGRFHVYEGHTPQQATLLIRAFKLLGVNDLIITCAAGGLDKSFNVSDIMLITDHVNFTGTNPLIGLNLDNFGPRFLGMFDIYTHRLQEIAQKVAINSNIELQSGIYAAILGPVYATRAELALYINSNCQAIGMSLVHEAIVAAHSGMDILALAAITDMALPDLKHHATGAEVIIAGQQITNKLMTLIKCIVNYNNL